jgi:hypothetical protein
MLLEVRFLGLRLRFGVRVSGVVDDTCQADGRTMRVERCTPWALRSVGGARTSSGRCSGRLSACGAAPIGLGRP